MATSSRRNATSTTPRTDVYERITAKIIDALEAGVRPWSQPWRGGGSPKRPLRANGIPYRGINTVLLWMEAQARGYHSPYWMTYKQAQELGAQVRKGEHSALVVYANAIERTVQTDAGEELEQRIPFMKGYSVFNAAQIDGLPDKFDVQQTASDALPVLERLEHVDIFFANLGANITEGGHRAFYRLGDDSIHVPAFSNFVSAEAYASTLAHECVHWTRHESRLNRDFGRKAYGDEGYAREELVAELGAAFLSADLGILIDVRDDHASYISEWIKVLKGDKRAIVQAASHAERAVAYLHSFQPEASSPAEEDRAA